MFFLKTYSLGLFALLSLALAAPSPGGVGGVSQCNTGKTYCCNSIQSSDSSSSQLLSGLLGLGLGNIPVQLGLGCTPITVVGVLTGTQCNTQPVCCENDQFNGLVNVGCTPLSL